MHNNFLCPLWGDATSHVPYAHGSLLNPVFPIAHGTWTQHITIACLLRFAHERPGAARHRRQTDASWFAPCAQRQKHPVFSAAVVQQHDDYIIFIIKKMSKTEESHDILHVLLFFFNERLDLDLGYLMWMFTPMKWSHYQNNTGIECISFN